MEQNNISNNKNSQIEFNNLYIIYDEKSDINICSKYCNYVKKEMETCKYVKLCNKITIEQIFKAQKECKKLNL